jgi:CO/xanthine dehydrogenase Mo-binding subunit
MTNSQVTNFPAGSSKAFSRRDLLKAGGALVVGFAFGGRGSAQTADSPNGPAVTPLAAAGKAVDIKKVDSFLVVHPDGSVTVYTGKVDLGTGLRIAIRQMAAEELDLPMEKVSLVDGDTGITPDQGATGGSTGLTRGGIEVRQAAATARQALLQLVGGMPQGGIAGAIGSLKGGKLFEVDVDPKAPLKSWRDYKVVGQPLLRPDVPGKCTARHTYVQDVNVPGMLHGRVVRPPTLGAKVMSVDEASIKAIPDVRLVHINNFVAVVAKNEWAAIRASRELKVTWSDWQGLPGSDAMEAFLRKGPTAGDTKVVDQGDPAKGIESAAKKVAATFYWPNQSHASLGPSCAVADFKNDGVTVWSSAQAPHGLRDNLARVLGLSADKVRVVYTDGAGCYGGNGNDDASAEAVLLSKTVGAPVRVQWMRQEEHAWDPKGPQQMLDMRAGVDAQGNIAGWDVEMWVPAALPGGRPLLSIDAAGMAQDHGQNSGLLTQNADPAYKADAVRVVSHAVKDTPLRPSNLRAPGKIANAWATETVTDELALAAGIDPVEFRLRGLTDPRAIAVIKKAAEMFGWQPRTAPAVRQSGNLMVGRGFAYARYKQAENYVAIALETAVDRSTGRIQVRRVTCAHDCGLTINPNALRNQIEGLILQTLSRTIYEEVKFDRSKVTSVDWVSYPILRFPEVPTIEIALMMDHQDQPLYGAGEAAAIPVPGALANAIFDATGIRMRVAPFAPERLKGALTRS